MLFVCDVLEHLEEMIGQSAINRRSRSPAARAPCGAARRWGGGGLFFFRKLSSARGKRAVLEKWEPLVRRWPSDVLVVLADIVRTDVFCQIFDDSSAFESWKGVNLEMKQAGG